MPDRPKYIPRKQPPDLLDILGFNLLELVIGLYSLTVGILRFIDGYTPTIALTTRTIPPLPSSLISIVMVAGGGMWVYAIFKRFHTVNLYYWVLRTGLSFVWIAWAAYFVVAIVLKPTIASVWLLALFMFTASFGLYIQSFHNEKMARKDKETPSPGGE